MRPANDVALLLQKSRVDPERLATTRVIAMDAD
jgi:hypothetical protein